MWTPLIREYDNLSQEKLTSVSFHPLTRSKATLNALTSSAPDPLCGSDLEVHSSLETKRTVMSTSSRNRVDATDDPLRLLLDEKTSGSLYKTDGGLQDNSTLPHKHFEPWRVKKGAILKKYRTNQQIPVNAKFLDAELLTESDESLARLETLKIKGKEISSQQSSGSGSEEFAYLSQRQLIYHAEKNMEQLQVAWRQGQRLKALKDAIQCAKMLTDTSVPQFYPSMFVLCTDILEKFGELVFDRIRTKEFEAGIFSSPIPHNFQLQDIPPEAKETCKNWFLKCAIIRELIPRFYVEVALCSSYRFLLSEDELAAVFVRLARMIRGIGDPLAALYARTYLALKAHDVIPLHYHESMLVSFNDFLFSFKEMKKKDFENVALVRNGKIEIPLYLDLFSPGIQWLVQNVGFSIGDNREHMFALLQQYQECVNHSFVLFELISSFDSSFIAEQAMTIISLIQEAEDSVLSSHHLYVALGQAIIESPPPKKIRLSLLNHVWKVVTKLTNPFSYTSVALVFIEYVLVHFSQRELNILLVDVLKHVKRDQAYKTQQKEISAIVEKILSHSPNIEELLINDTFMLVVDLLEKDFKYSTCKKMLDLFQRSRKKTSDPVLIHTLFGVAKSVHDNIDSLSYLDERRQISKLIVGFTQMIDFGRDLEQQLNTYVQCRNAFTQLDMVTAELIHSVALLAMTAHRIMKGKHTKKTSAFVKACLAYCHITIPSLDDIFLRLNLFLLCGEISLTNQLVVHSEAFLKAAISTLPEAPSVIERFGNSFVTTDLLVSWILHFASFLLVFPGHPNHGPFYLVHGLLNGLQAYQPWKMPEEKEGTEAGDVEGDKHTASTPAVDVPPSPAVDISSGAAAKARVFLGVFSLFCGYYQRRFLYHFKDVESNDTLYGQDESYLSQVSVFLNSLSEQIQQQLILLGDSTLLARKTKATFSLDFANLLLSHITLNKDTANFFSRLCTLAVKNEASPQYLQATFKHLSCHSGSIYKSLVAKLQSEMTTKDSLILDDKIAVNTQPLPVPSSSVTLPLTPSSISKPDVTSIASVPISAKAPTLGIPTKTPTSNPIRAHTSSPITKVSSPTTHLVSSSSTEKKSFSHPLAHPLA